MSGGKSAGAGARVGGVDGGVGEAIEGHGGGAGGEHGDDDPEKLMGGGKAGSGEHGPAESEGEGEDGVLPLNHFESDAEIVKEGHGDDCRTCVGAVLSSQFSVLSKSTRRFLSRAVKHGGGIRL